MSSSEDESQSSEHCQQQTNELNQSSQNMKQEQSMNSECRDVWYVAQQCSSQDVNENERDRIQNQILAQAAGQQQISSYQRQLSEDIVKKVNECRSAAKEKQGQQLVNIRVEEVVYTKLLVLNYNYSDFRLVVAYYHLGEAYLEYGCIEQAIEHLSLAIHKNEKLFEQLPKARLIQGYLMVALAQLFMSQNNYDDALDMLLTQDTVKVLVLQAQCYSKQKKFVKALEVMELVLQKTAVDKISKVHSILVRYKIHQQGTLYISKIQHAFALVEKANIYAATGTEQHMNLAIKTQEEAINILIEDNYNKPQEVAELYGVLAEYFERVDNGENALTCTQKVRTLYQQLYSPTDKRVIKARRKIATALLRATRYKEAVNQLLEIADLQCTVFGENCLQSARTLKLLGTVYASLQATDAEAYLKRAMTIFNTHGHKKQAEEIKEKIKQIIKKRRSENNDMGVKVSSQQDF